MNNEETMIMQPKNEAKKSVETTNTATPKETKKEEQKNNTTAKVAATAAAGVFGGAAGGAASVAAANMMDNQEPVEEEVKAEVAAEAKPAPKAEPSPVVEEKTEESDEIIGDPDEPQEPDYSGNEGSDPVVQGPEPQPTGNEGDDAHEVQVLGVYENGEGQELVILTDGERGGAVLDATGNGEGDLLWVDGSDGSTPDGMMQEGEVIDITEQHIQMSQYEDAYLAQQQEQMQQEHETFAYNADDQQDYNNDAPDLSFA